MSAQRTIDQGGPAFPEIGNVAYNSEWQSESGMSLRDYYAAHCPMTMREAYGIWRIDGSSMRGLADGNERRGFLEWWSIMRFEYADAMIAARKGDA